MPHDWHETDILSCLRHAESFARSAMSVLAGDPVGPSMQSALHSDITDIHEDIIQAQRRALEVDANFESYRPEYVKHLEGVVFVQLHQIQQLRKEVAKHAAPA